MAYVAEFINFMDLGADIQFDVVFVDEADPTMPEFRLVSRFPADVTEKALQDWADVRLGLLLAERDRVLAEAAAERERLVSGG